LGAVYDQHIKHEFVDLDLEATMATMGAEPHTYFAPTCAGGLGHHGVSNFYTHHFIGSNKPPADWKISVVSRTVGEDRLVEEFIVGFTHDVEMGYILPGIPPPGKWVEVPHVVVVTFTDAKIAIEHIYWDQALVLVQVGLLDPDKLPVVGAEQARKLSRLVRG
jgi:carboxymethylenebutenolidase